jgi:hypothetical protein
MYLYLQPDPDTGEKITDPVPTNPDPIPAQPPPPSAAPQPTEKQSEDKIIRDPEPVPADNDLENVKAKDDVTDANNVPMVMGRKTVVLDTRSGKKVY